jgi:hypothetical protein
MAGKKALSLSLTAGGEGSHFFFSSYVSLNPGVEGGRTLFGRGWVVVRLALIVPFFPVS